MARNRGRFFTAHTTARPTTNATGAAILYHGVGSTDRLRITWRAAVVSPLLAARRSRRSLLISPRRNNVHFQPLTMRTNVYLSTPPASLPMPSLPVGGPSENKGTALTLT